MEKGLLHKQIRDFFVRNFDVRQEKEDELETIESIRKGIEFKGTNLWVLIFATFVAPVDLSSCSPPSPFDAHAGCFKRLRSRLSAPHFTDSHFHGPVRRFALDTSDRLRPLLPRLVFRPPIPGQRQLQPRVPL